MKQIKSIEELAGEFRNAMDVVKAERLYGRLSLFSSFPNGCCGYTSDLLAEYLIDNGIERERIQHVACTSCIGDYSHCWLVIDDALIVDITADQYNGRLHFQRFMPISNCCLKPTGTYLYSLFNVKKEDYTHNVGIESYSGDMPAKLRIIYDAALQILRNSKLEK